MKILLTGCNGQVGWEVCRQAAEYQFEVVATDIHNLDITDINSVREAQQKANADIIINAAAYTAVDKAEVDQDLAHAVNATGAQILATVAKEANVPVFHISTDYVFSGDATVPYLESDPKKPTGVYGKTKLDGEQLVESANEKHITLRTSWVFGIEGNNFVKTMVRLGAENDELTVVSDQFGSPTFAGNIARALLMLAKLYNEGAPMTWGTYNFCDSGPTTWHAFASRIIELAYSDGVIKSKPLVKPILTADFPTAAKRPHYSVLNCNHFLSTYPTIGIQSWDTGLRRLISSLDK